MSEWETVPEPEEIAEHTEEEWADYMQSVYDGMKVWWGEAKFHDEDGYFADVAGSEACLALGHTPFQDDTGEAWPGHPIGWNGEVLCEGTRYGVACMQCEGECEHERPESVWSMPGVIGAAHV